MQQTVSPSPLLSASQLDELYTVHSIKMFSEQEVYRLKKSSWPAVSPHLCVSPHIKGNELF